MRLRDLLSGLLALALFAATWLLIAVPAVAWDAAPDRRAPLLRIQGYVLMIVAVQCSNVRPPRQPLLAIDAHNRTVRRYFARQVRTIAGLTLICYRDAAEIPLEWVNSMGTIGMLNRLTAFRLNGEI